MSRDIASVIPSIVSLIPETESELLEKILNFIHNLVFKPPELRVSAHCWAPFIKILNTYVPEIKEDWQKQIVKIINNQE